MHFLFVSLLFLAAPITSFLPGKAFVRRSSTSFPAFSSRKDWDAILAGENEETPVRPDMKYIPRNCQRQHEHFLAIREAAGKELTNDVYVREPKSETFWFAGKVARVTDVTVEQAVARQWPLIEMHAGNLRPIELFPSRGALEIWIAPGDSEMEVAYNNPNLIFTKMEKDVPGAQSISNIMVGFQGEMYEPGEKGFRTWRKDDGTPARPPVETPIQDEKRMPTDEEMKELAKALEGKDINEIYEEQERRNNQQR
ncbi:hypothetical protein FisN_23Lh142 [Fistulifera solaris]|uniref:Uncharacterized protein n=1 Tax=Fistulifera solaris TaxID=1519565 RepID=A0A1Z5KLU3_FISSO|nr:hypothetical protein FisN_23Lh142 [Fistulifera solaris]|eukprot:GAX27290.1 hypothetical protein FisN_23Lh142 [Fistulifera solaris]